jgi:hypothetical protein
MASGSFVIIAAALYQGNEVMKSIGVDVVQFARPIVLDHETISESAASRPGPARSLR